MIVKIKYVLEILKSRRVQTTRHTLVFVKIPLTVSNWSYRITGVQNKDSPYVDL